MKKIKLFICVNIFFRMSSICNGLCIVPVADLLKQSAYETFMSLEKNFSSVGKAYTSLAMGDANCKREYQILYNELVEILQVKGEEAQIRVPHIIYFDEEKEMYTNVYWTLESNLVCLDELKVKNVDLGKIPEEVSFNQDIKPDPSIVVLKEPFKAQDGRIFSAGTRFKMKDDGVRIPRQARDERSEDRAQRLLLSMSKNSDCTKVSSDKRDEQKIPCYALNELLEEVVLEIPKSKLNFYKEKSIEGRISDFIKLVKSWANLKSGFIPYLYSGSSYTYSYYQDEILHRESDDTFYRDELDIYPYSGFDCSCIISRGTQICGLPYFYKDSTTLERNLEPLNDFEDLSIGDIIWFPGHVVIISDIKNNLVIEARGYASGFGRVHECHINKMFASVDSLESLFKAKKENRGLELLARDGSLRYKINKFKILSLKTGLYKEFKSLYNPVEKLDTSRCYKNI